MLDGESIRAAREAQGLSQAALAEKAGTTQQTVQRIERGEIEFSRAAQGICEALGTEVGIPTSGGVSPLVVLRTILCANPTAEQILAALAANGLTIVPVGARPPIATPNIPIDDPKAYVLDVLARHKLAPGALAAKIGVSPSTLTRALNDPDHKFKFAVTTLQKIKEWDQSQ